MSNNNISIVNMTNNNEVKPITVLKIHNAKSSKCYINNGSMILNIYGIEDVATQSIRRTNMYIDYNIKLLSVVNTVTSHEDLEYVVIPNNYLICYGTTAIIRINYTGKSFNNVGLIILQEDKQECDTYYGLYDFTELMKISNMGIDEVLNCFNNPVGFYEYCYKAQMPINHIEAYGNILLQNHSNKNNIIKAVRKLLEMYPDKWSEDLLNGCLLFIS